MITQARLKEVLHYDPNSGVFTNRAARGANAAKGYTAGAPCGGYLVIQIDYRNYKAHRLAWLYVYGYCPENDIDHINRIPSDNRIDNLREASRSCNVRNSKTRKDNTSGIRGVSWNKAERKWVAYIQISGKRKPLGTYDTKLQAAQARLAAEIANDFPVCHTGHSDAQDYVNKKT